MINLQMAKWVKYILITLAIVSLVSGAFVVASMLAPTWPLTITTPGHPESSSGPGQASNGALNPLKQVQGQGESPVVPLPDFPPVIAKVMPSVVAVTTEMVVSSRFGQYTQPAAGSGVIIDPNGYIATNNHVVEDARSIQVQLYDGRTFPATIVGTDALTDLAVLKIDATDLPYAPWGDSSQLRPGNWVIAIGNALGEGISASEGIVSRLDVSVTVEGNTLRGLVQTTAPINPGNSGGPLVNMAGEVTGITSVKIVALGFEGMGYAISSNSARPVIEGLIG